MPRRLVGLAAAIALLPLLSSCGGGDDGGGPTGPAPEPQVAAVEVSPDSALVSDSAGTRDFEATARDSAGNQIAGVDFAWESSDPAVATVDSTGRATGVAEGRVEIRATAEGVTGSSPLLVRFQMIEGFPGEPASQQIPDEPFEAPDSADFSGEEGVRISRRDVLLMFADGATVEEANDLLGALDARIQGGNPVGEQLYVEVPDRSVDEAFALADSLSADDRTAIATLDMIGSPERLPPHNARESWRWDEDSRGNWGLHAIRAPQMWNLGNLAAGDDNCVANVEGRKPVLDTSHPDLNVASGVNGGNRDHTTLVSGIMGAAFGNLLGVEGVDPWIRQHHARPLGNFANLANGVIRVLQANSCVRAFNYSWGVPWTKVSASDRAKVENVVRKHGKAVKKAIDNAVSKGTGPPNGRFALVSSAGNDGMEVVKFNDPITFAADSFGGRYFAVAATDSADDVADFSNSPASVVAPGVCVRGTESGNGSNYDSGSCPDRTKDAGSGSPNNDLYGTNTGTSFAAPQVSGLITALWSLEPSLSVSDMRRLITDGDYTVDTGETPERIDAFAAATGIDQIGGTSFEVQRALVNVDDGTADGNLRVDPFTGDPVGGLVPDRPGDDAVTMRDFRAFRDAFLQLHGGSLPFDPDVRLDGPPDHVTRDLNRDGCVVGNPTQPERFSGVDCSEEGILYGEELFPRYDFNGTGRVDLGGAQVPPDVPDSALAPFKVDPDEDCTSLDSSIVGCLRDIDVMAGVWSNLESEVNGENVRTDAVEEPTFSDCEQPPEQWTPTALRADRGGPDEIDYIRSFDLHGDVAQASTDDQQTPFEESDHLAFVLPAVDASGLSLAAPDFVKCRSAAWEGVVSILAGGSADVRYLVTRSQDEVTDVRYFFLVYPNTLTGPGADAALTASFDTLALHRSDGTSALDVGADIQVEVIYRSVSDPVDDPGGHAFWTSPCLGNEASTLSDRELYKRLVEKADELWLQGDPIEPRSLVREKTESFGHTPEIERPVAIELEDPSCPEGEDKARLWGAWIDGDDTQ